MQTARVVGAWIPPASWGQVTFTPTKYTDPQLARTKEELQTQSPVIPTAAEAGPPKRGHKFGQKAKPLVNLPLEQIVIDELHLMLRIMDVLADHLLQQTMR
eukprot:scpid110744/ scgid17875/ 